MGPAGLYQGGGIVLKEDLSQAIKPVVDKGSIRCQICSWLTYMPRGISEVAQNEPRALTPLLDFGPFD